MLYQILTYGFDHEPEVYDCTAPTTTDAISEAISAYSRDSGMPEEAIDVKVIRAFDEHTAPQEAHGAVTVPVGPLLPQIDHYATEHGWSRAQAIYELVWQALSHAGYTVP